MNYISTRGNYPPVQAAEAIRLGMVPEGGLFVPGEVPQLSFEEINKHKHADYQELATWILGYFLEDFSGQELEEAVTTAYHSSNFPVEGVTPLVRLGDNTYILELWHGPTAAFKDMALQLMPELLVRAVKKSGIDREVVILVATSGDTGKAALEGFKGVDGIRIIVFYPEAGVSQIQEDQMITTGGNNTEVVAVRGNFDDCQTAVKGVFGDRDFNRTLKQNGYQFSSANSINWGRLVPQIVYYFAAYLNLLEAGKIEERQLIDIVVPTGNFGNILAGYYASRMGLPVNKFICASNENKVLTDFLRTGVYDIKRDFKKTISPSMDILISSNLERFLFEVTGHDSQKIRYWYNQLREQGGFEIDSGTLKEIQSLFVGEFARETEVKQIIKTTFEQYNYLVDPHTGVGLSCLQSLRKARLSDRITVVDSTANPFKFGRAVLEALTGEVQEGDDYLILERLQEFTGWELHRGLAGLRTASPRHSRNCRPTGVPAEIEDILGL
ncbi:MAG: threonine synthase [Bacillota bacterium]